MTNQEAISRLHTIDGWGEREHEAIAMAIKALEQPEPCEDTIGRQATINVIKKRLFETAFNNVGIKQNIDETLVDVAENRLETWFDELPSVQPDIIRCKDCKHWNPQLKTANGNGLGSCDFHNVALVTSKGFCYWAERKEE